MKNILHKACISYLFYLPLYCNESSTLNPFNMNDFDFFTVNASSNRITSLMKLPNVKRSNIEHRVHYGSGKYPTHIYKVTLAYYDVMEFGHYGAKKRANDYIESLLATKPDNVILSIKFYPVD